MFVEIKEFPGYKINKQGLVLGKSGKLLECYYHPASGIMVQLINREMQTTRNVKSLLEDTLGGRK